MDVLAAIEALRSSRPIFHSEADFQHALAWKLHERHPSHSIRLEYRPPSVDGRMFLDVWVTSPRGTWAIELKYKTRRLTTSVNGEPYHLLDQSAQDIGRYDFLKDVQRLEQVVSSGGARRGYAILLTNDSSYWTRPGISSTVDSDFRVHEGRVLSGELRWQPHAGPGTTRGREAAIGLSGRYQLRWRDYSQPADGRRGLFRYLPVEVAPPGQ